MLVDIIIPAYNSHKTILRTLKPIQKQDILEYLNIIIVNDASKEDYQKEVSLFKEEMSIKEIKLEKNSGPGQARQIGIDNSNSEFIIFIDSDDEFYNNKSVSLLLNSIINSEYDMVASKFLSEKDDGSYEEIFNNIWLHGKIYRRKFLEDHNIRFNDSYANEDNGFNTLLYLLDSNIGIVEEITYIWCKNENSITRKNNREYDYTGKFGYIYNMTWAIETAIERGINNNKLKEKILYVLFSIYFYYLKFMNEVGVEEMLEKSKKLKEIYDKNKLYDRERIDEIYNEEYNYIINEINDIGELIKKISFEEFLERIGD